MKKIKIEIAVFFLIVLIVLQFIKPKKNNLESIPTSDFITVTNTQETLAELLKTSCYNCHSNNSEYPWYSNVAPFSYWISNHISEGKEHLNFSEWEAYSLKQKINLLNKLEEQVKEKQKMPLRSYLWMHTEAKLSDDQKEKLINWTNDLRFIYQLGVQ